MAVAVSLLHFEIACFRKDPRLHSAWAWLANQKAARVFRGVSAHLVRNVYK